MKGVIYARYSSDNQREESIEGQIRENMAYAERNGIEIVGTYIDRAYSARTDRRPDFQRMIKDSAKKNFDVVIVWKLDRFAGNRFNKNSLTRIFSNRKYIGEYRYKDIVFPDAMPAIVTKELFERVSARLKSNKHATGKSKAPERYLLTTKLFCGTCKCMLVGDSANKPYGVIYRYYKCAGAKRHECDRKAVRKDWIEDKVVELVASIIYNEENLCHIADELMVLLSKGSELIPVLEAQLKEVRKSIRNMIRAIEQGITTRNTKAHLLELEAEEDRLVANIQAEEEKLPKISREMILFALHRFSNLNLSIAKNKERLIDGMVKAILLYDDRIVVYLSFKDEPLTIPTIDELRDMENSSDIGAAASP